MTHWVMASLLGVALLSGSARGEKAAAVICSIDKPVISSGETAAATVLTDAPNRDGVAYRWTAAGGEFEEKQANSSGASGSIVHWRPSGGDKGSYTLSASVHAGDQVIGTCSLEVMVAAGARSASAGPGYKTEGSILVQGSMERPGYGLYSYILLAGPPEGEAVARVHALFEAYLQRIAAVKGLESYFKSSQLNVTYLPMQKATEDKPSVDSLLDNYDYARAQLLLSRVPGQHNTGPYIVSSLNPLTTGTSVKGAYLFEDLSNVPASAIPFWIQQFLSQTSQQRFWEANTLDSVALRLRTGIAIAAEGLPDVRKGVASWIVLSPGR